VLFLDTTKLAVHLNGAWVQGSGREMLLIETNEMTDLDQLTRLKQNILLDFMAKFYCKLLIEAVRLDIDDVNIFSSVFKTTY
ncbi:14943_t:CDS:1, partial [Funneliformis mosseae]